MLGASVAWKVVINRRQVEVHLAGVLRLELVDLEVDDDEAAQAEVVEEQVEIEILATDFEVVLTADECEALAEFENERPEVVEQAALQLPLGNVIRDVEELEAVGILHQLPRQVRLRRWQGLGEIRDCFALAADQPAFDLVDENSAAPAVLDRPAGIPEPVVLGFQRVEQAEVMPPGQSCNNLLHNLQVRVGFGKGPHVGEVACRQPGHVREVAPQVLRKPLHRPALFFRPTRDPRDGPRPLLPHRPAHLGRGIKQRRSGGGAPRGGPDPCAPWRRRGRCSRWAGTAASPD